MDDPVLMCEELQRKGVGITAWEEEFLDDIAQILDRGWTLTSAQEEKLEEIYEERLWK